MQQRVSIARAIVHDPAVVLLDEPYTGLDASGASALSSLLFSLRDHGAAMVLVTHNLDEGLAVASHAAVMVRGSFARITPTAGLNGVEFAREYRGLTGVVETSAA
jgi:heme exporter protein A